MKINNLRTLIQRMTGLALLFALAACTGEPGGGGEEPPPNNPPEISGAPDTSAEAGSIYSFTPVATDADDDDTLTFTVENNPHWLLLDETTGTLSGTPFAADIDDYADITISVSDGTDSAQLAPFSVSVLPQKLGVESFTATGTVTPTANGYHTAGSLTMNTGERIIEFLNADLNVEFDEDGKLVDLSGEADLPGGLDGHTAFPANIRAVVGTLSGADINADPDFGIQLVDETRYLVFYIGAGIDIVMTVPDPADPSSTVDITITTPYGGEIIFIADPTDPMLYRFAGTPILGEFGTGNSFNGLLPFTPELDFAGLDSFNGHDLMNGSMGIGFKFVDFFTVGGTRVIKNPQFRDIDWDNPLQSSIEYRAGINGLFDFGFSVVGFGLLSFELADGSATIDVGLDRQQVAMALRIAPDTSWLPDWVHVVPDTELEGAAFANGDGDFAYELAGGWKSQVPVADLTGTMLIENAGVTLTGSTSENGDTLAVSMAFLNNETIGRIEFPESYAASLKADVSSALDDEITKVTEALAELQEATADYEFEVSLRGLREALPPMMTGAISTLNGIPDTVYDEARSAALSKMASTCHSVTIDPGFGLPSYTQTTCIDDLVNETSIANSVASTAKGHAEDAIVPYVEAMSELRTRAMEADDEMLRDALRLALKAAYDHRRFSKSIKVTRNIDAGVFDATYTMYDDTVTKAVLSSTQASQVLTAHDNVYRIQETSDTMISAQQVFDALPIEEVIADVKQQVEDGITAVPEPEGLGYRAFNDNYEAFVTIDGVDHAIAINVLKPSEVKDGVSDLLADLLLDAVP